MLNKSEVFLSIPFLKAYQLSLNDLPLFEYLIEREIRKIKETSKEDLYTEIQLSWLIKASLIIPLKMKSFF